MELQLGQNEKSVQSHSALNIKTNKNFLQEEIIYTRDVRKSPKMSNVG